MRNAIIHEPRDAYSFRLDQPTLFPVQQYELLSITDYDTLASGTDVINNIHIQSLLECAAIYSLACLILQIDIEDLDAV